jgi:hypothetical protein
MAARIKLDFTKFFQDEAKKLIASYRRLLTQKKGIRMDAAPHNADSTVERKGKDHWMIDTRDLYKNGFKSSASKDRMIVQASDEKHSGRYTYMGVPGGHKGQRPYVRRAKTQKRTYQKRNIAKIPTYKQLFLWHNKKGYSGIFGQFPAGSRFPSRFKKELNRQLDPQFKNEFSKRIKTKVRM